jgi:hypothetical protein
LFYYAQPILAAVVGVASAWYTIGIPLQEAREQRLRQEAEQKHQKNIIKADPKSKSKD